MLLYSTKYTQKIKITVCNEEFKNELKVDEPTVCPHFSNQSFKQI
jgi:hypothetical protein